jgi:tetratricopeptide (TPR) repeat protein
MTETPTLADFRHGLIFLRDGHPAQALEYFRRAAELEKRNPIYLFFLGLSVARAQKKWTMAVEFCETALRMKRNEAQLYLNLAEVYVSAGRRENAIQILDTAVGNIGHNARIRRIRDKLGRRHASVLPFLDRQHFLNRGLGKWRHRAVAYFRRSES